MVGCVLSQLKPSELYTFLAVEKASAFSTAKNVELLVLYPIRIIASTMFRVGLGVSNTCDARVGGVPPDSGAGPDAVVKAACLESRRSRFRAPLWPSSFK